MNELERENALLDLGSEFWRTWFATRSQVDTMARCIDRCDFLARKYACVIVCADSPTNWRHEITAELPKEQQYKANRPRKDPESVLCLKATEARLEELGYPVIKCDGYEADDVIATLASQSNGRSLNQMVRWEWRNATSAERAS